MYTIDLQSANRIIEAGIAIRKQHGHLPLTFCVLDRGGHLVSAQREDDSSIMRFEIAFGKAWASLALGHSTRFQEVQMSKNRPHFLDSLAAVANGPSLMQPASDRARRPERAKRPRRGETREFRFCSMGALNR